MNPAIMTLSGGNFTKKEILDELAHAIGENEALKKAVEHFTANIRTSSGLVPILYAKREDFDNFVRNYPN